MPRSTLKLPTRKSAPQDGTGGARTLSRKPIRGGSRTAKHIAPWRPAGDRAAAPTSRPGAGTDGAQHLQRATISQTHHEAERTDSTVSPSQRNRSDLAHALESRSTTTEAQVPRAVVDKPKGRSEEASGGRQTADGPRDRKSRVYPERGIARSTGARAFPPAPRRPDNEVLKPGDDRGVSPATVREPPAPPQAAKRVAAAGGEHGLPKEAPRLSKLVSGLAMCSRREADEWIENGWVSVDGAVITRLGARVNPKASIVIKEIAGGHCTESVTIVFNKLPSALPADDGASAVSCIRADNRWADDQTTFRFKAAHLRGLASAGRLEAEEAGMLVFTQEGSVARRLTGGDSRLEKEYHVRCQGELAPGGLELLRHGLSLDNVKLRRAQVSWLGEQQLRFVLHESRTRHIQRMCDLVGLRATEIKRVRIGSVSLGRLAPGQWRYLRPDERF